MSSQKKHYLAEAEEQMLDLWAKEKTFEQSLKQRENKEQFTFYDGPPYANGMPHHGHAVQSVLKDSITRYKTMRGYYVPRRTGWDTHGLPIEYKIEQEMGFNGKSDILEYGIDKFNQKCRESVFKHVDEWNDFFDRIGRWRDTENQYATLDNSYIESVWWVFAQIYKKGLVYEDLRSTAYCPRCATPLSNFEVNQGYQDDVEDPSFFVKFKLKDDKRKLIAWTTTPWSLPGNAALAVAPGETYVTVVVKNDEGNKEQLILAEKLLEVLDEEYEVQAQMSGEELVGLEYEPLFKLDAKVFPQVNNKNAYKIWSADFVSVEDGSGVLHVAPAFGEDDLSLGKDKDLPVLSTIDENGKVRTGLGWEGAEGKFFKTADKLFIEYLTQQGDVFAASTIKHTYPFCWRCDTPLLYYASNSWFISVSELRDKLVSNNQQVNWVPNHIRDGRFGKWLEGARDWAFSRNRFWGAPVPLWKTDDGQIIVVESVDELKSLAKDPESINDLHRPFIDDVEITMKNGQTAKRIDEVFDVWFESGCMPYGQDHYPFENKETMEANFPADFIAEAQDQTRGWFYTLHVLSTIVFDKPAFQNCITTGWVNAADGEKLSKRKKNYTPLDTVFDMYGADALRLFILTSPIVQGEDIRFSSEFLKEVQRNTLITLQNTYNFFKTYSQIDDWQPPKELKEPEVDYVLDKWILARLNKATESMTNKADKYQVNLAVKPLSALVDDLSNWYVRRSRRRFWKSQDDSDKQQAYDTLYYVLVRVMQLMAPWAPFMSDRVYRQLTEGSAMPKSVHLTDWPEVGEIDQQLLNSMKLVRDVITEALSQRADAGVKVRQPLGKLEVITVNPISDDFADIIKEEVNVKDLTLSVGAGQQIKLDSELTDELKAEGLMREVIRRVQNARKQADLQVDDRIMLHLKADDKLLEKAINKHKQAIAQETLVDEWSDKELGYNEQTKIEGSQLTIGLQKI